jgi:hypothetical protein
MGGSKGKVRPAKRRPGPTARRRTLVPCALCSRLTDTRHRCSICGEVICEHCDMGTLPAPTHTLEDHRGPP